MALELQNAVIRMVQELLSAELARTPDWLMRPGKSECGTEWPRICEIYGELTTLSLPDVMRPIERRTVDAVLIQSGRAPRILEIDEKQHFNEFRAMTFNHYGNVKVAFDIQSWKAASKAKVKLEGGGFARPMPPLFPEVNGRHKQRAFRDALCDILPCLHGFEPTVRIADFEVKGWLTQSGAKDRMAHLLANRGIY